MKSSWSIKRNDNEDGNNADEEDENKEEIEDDDEDNDNGDENEDDEGEYRLANNDEDVSDFNSYVRTSHYRVYKLDQRNDNFVGVQSLGYQLFFFSDACVSLLASDFQGLEGNCLFCNKRYM